MTASREKITIDVIEHYPKANRSNTGTVHVFWEEMGMDIKGCVYYLKKDREYVMLPSFIGTDKVKYPAINFVDNERQKALFEAINIAFQAYAKEKKMKFTFVTKQKKLKSSPKFRQMQGKVIKRTFNFVDVK